MSTGYNAPYQLPDVDAIKPTAYNDLTECRIFSGRIDWLAIAIIAVVTIAIILGR